MYINKQMEIMTTVYYICSKNKGAFFYFYNSFAILDNTTACFLYYCRQNMFISSCSDIPTYFKQKQKSNTTGYFDYYAKSMLIYRGHRLLLGEVHGLMCNPALKCQCYQSKKILKNKNYFF